MIVKNEQLMRALEALSRAYKRVAGARTETSDDAMALAALDSVLAEHLHTRPELIHTLTYEDLRSLDAPILASLGRLWTLRAAMLHDLAKPGAAAQSATLAFHMLRQTLRERLDDEDRYAAHHLHRLLVHPIAAQALSPDEVAPAYVELFDFYAEHRIDDRAEDTLFHALELLADNAPERARLGQRARSYYHHLRTLDETELRRRGLSRFDITQALADLDDLLGR
ncbi:hypothetical protein EA187_03300 [Lujinxingia sediminis]|uniref:HD domain-containing protein n=1 Tax=Lujinxingia sediminis TaxID=2480984 RepID=A0ABY0CXV6_9DELT|nr:DUF6483 family protein [Lujinxingia sediminis]RVU48475.1 hypothetical protein EA187_03300 [Lujinxingia sediminis]